MPATTVGVTSSTQLLVGWMAPITPGGVISGYRLYQNGVSVANTTGTVYQASNLLPHTTYSYNVEACNSVGCAAGPSTAATTADALPVSMPDPTIVSVGSRRLDVRWSPPVSPNGVIILYNVYVRVCSSMTTCTSVSGTQGTKVLKLTRNCVPHICDL